MKSINNYIHKALINKDTKIKKIVNIYDDCQIFTFSIIYSCYQKANIDLEEEKIQFIKNNIYKWLELTDKKDLVEIYVLKNKLSPNKLLDKNVKSVDFHSCIEDFWKNKNNLIHDKYNYCQIYYDYNVFYIYDIDLHELYFFKNVKL